jgi:hypothetical protein
MNITIEVLVNKASSARRTSTGYYNEPVYHDHGPEAWRRPKGDKQ